MKRAGETRWRSHYGDLVNLSLVFSYVVEVLKILRVDSEITKTRAQTNTYVNQSYSDI